MPSPTTGAEETLDEVLACERDLNRQLPAEEQLEEGPDVVIVGEGGTLDSLSIINLLVAIEDRMRDRFGVEASLVDAAADGAPEVATIGALASWLHVLR